MAINADALKILLNLNGADTSTTITDSSSYGSSITNNQGSYGYNSTDTSKFGSACGKFLNDRSSHVAVDVTHDTGTLETDEGRVYGITLPVGTVVYNVTRSKYAIVYDYGTIEVDISGVPTDISYFDITPPITGQDAGDTIYYAGSDVIIPNTNISFNEDFSIKFWIKRVDGTGIILDTRSSLNDTDNFYVTLEDDFTIKVKNNYSNTKGSQVGKAGDTLLATTTAISNSSFDYVEIARKGTSFGIYINETLEDWITGFNFYNFDSNSNIQLGNVVGAGGSGFDGYIDEFQIWDGASVNNVVADILTLESAEYSSDDVDIEISNVVLQTEIEETNIEVSNIMLQTEIEESSVVVSNVVLQVEFDPDTIVKPEGISPPSIYQTTATILICDYQGTVSAESGTVEGTIYSTGHGYNQDDFIVNTTQNNTSRRMLSTTTDTITVVSVSGQTQSDIIRAYKFTDHTGQLKQQTLNVNKKIEEDTEARFTLITDGTYVPRAGQYVKVSTNSVHVFTGFIKSVKRRLPQNGVDTKIFFDVVCTTLNNITPRRTLAIAYDIDTTASVIVESMVNNFLVSEGIGSGTIEDGVVLDDDWIDDSLTISDIIDSLAERSGFQWFIDKNFLLQFYQDLATVSEYSQSITDVGSPTFNDFRNVTINETVENYNNKAFYIGNTDDYGNIIIVSQENTTSILEIQDYAGGSGVYGTVVHDTNMTNHNFYTATAGTTESTIVAPNIGDEVDIGDLVFNATQYERRNVIASSGNTLTLQSEISGQTQSDVIVVYQQINDVVDNHLKRSDVIPRILEFDTFTTDMEPTQKLQVRLSKLSVTTTETYIIESVNIQDRGAGYYVTHVVASRRNADNISTQRTPTYKDYFKEF